MIGGESLAELREAFAEAEAEIEGGVSPRVAPFADLRDLGALLQRAGFALPVTDVDRVTVRYASPLALMHDLRRMGAANALTERRRTPLRRATLAADAGDLCRDDSPIRTAASARRSRSSGCRAGRRTRASRSRCAGLGEDAARRCACARTEIPAGEKAGALSVQNSAGAAW